MPDSRSNLKMNGHKVTGLGNGSASDDAAAFGQVPVIDATAGDISTSAVGDTAAAGASTQVAAADHKHAREGFGAVTAETSFGGASANGTAATVARSDHTHGNPAAATTAVTQSPGDNSTKIATTAYADAAITAEETAAKTLTNKRVTKRVLALAAGAAAPAINTDSYDAVHITAQTAAITSFTTNLTGTPNDGDELFISVTDDGTARAITWGAKFEAGLAPLPTTTVISTRLDVRFAWNTETSKWRVIDANILDSTAGDITTSAVGDSAAAGTNALAARADHKHGRESFATPGASAVGDVAAAGSASTLPRSDHTHGREAFGAPTAQTSYGGSSATGTATTVPHSDHTHGTPALSTNTPVAVGTAAAGAGTAPSKDDHVHPNTAATQSAGDNSTKIATTAYADAADTALLTATKTMTNKRITKRVSALSAGAAAPAINTDNFDVVHITGQSAAITSFTTNLTGTPVDGDELFISITDNGTARAITWGTSFEAGIAPLPTTTVISTRLDVRFAWNTETSKWRVIDANVMSLATPAALGTAAAGSGTLASRDDHVHADTVVTQSPGTNSTKVASTAYADAAITAERSATATETNKRITKRVTALSAGSATPAINTDNFDVCNITAQSAAITSFTMTGTPVDGDTLRISITDNGTARAITWGTSFEASGNVALPTTTVINVRLDVGFFWNTATSKWRCVGVA